MIRNEFIYELGIDFDLDYIKDLVLNKKPNKVPGLADHHRRVRDDEYMTSLKEKYPCLSEIYNIYVLPKGLGIPMHIDKDRKSALNIPIQGTESTDTVFFKVEGDLEIVYDEKRIYNLVKSSVSEVFRNTLSRPLLINNSIPHRVVNRDLENIRISVSWSMLPDVTFDEAIKIFNE
jgi:hypothetical protein